MKTLILIVATIAAVDSACDDGWEPFGENCFKFDNTGRNYADAEAFCVGLGAHLVSIHSDEENEFVIDKARELALGNTWIGLDDNVAENNFRYLDGSDFYRGGFTRAEPNNWRGNQDCAYFPFREKYGWDDMGCTQNAAVMCEKDQLPCPEGWREFGGHCYLWSRDSLNYGGAKERCTNRDAYLVSITTPEENRAVIDMVREISGQDFPVRTWIGFDDEAQEGFWRMIDPGNSDFLGRFARGEPNNAGDNQNCIWFPFGGAYYWDDVSCGSSRSAVCKKSDPSLENGNIVTRIQDVLAHLNNNCITSGTEAASEEDSCSKLRRVFQILISQCGGGDLSADESN